MKLLSCLLLVILTAGPSCTKEKIKIDISGYTSTDASGNFTGVSDPSDWTFDASWSTDETNIFSGLSAGDLTGTSAGTVTVYPAYPNPSAGDFSLFFTSTTDCKVRIAIVNNKLGILASQTLLLHPGSNVNFFALAANYEHGKLYRLYYVFDAAGSPAFKKGHGDIMLQ